MNIFRKKHYFKVKMKRNKKIVGFGKKHIMRILRFLIIVLFILIMILVFKNYYPLIFIPIVIYWYISIFKQVNVCIFEKDKIYVKSDNTNSFEHLQVQKAFEIHYSEIESIEIINSRYKNTRGEDYLMGFDGRLLTSEDILSEKLRIIKGQSFQS